MTVEQVNDEPFYMLAVHPSALPQGYDDGIPLFSASSAGEPFARAWPVRSSTLREACDEVRKKGVPLARGSENWDVHRPILIRILSVLELDEDEVARFQPGPSSVN